jgi:hypothetical protein
VVVAVPDDEAGVEPADDAADDPDGEPDDEAAGEGDPPHAVSHATSASPAAYETSRRGVGFVTVRSVNRRF